MTFKEAFELMKLGKKMKLPSWGGYWCWDKDKQTIMMYCKDTGKNILDIRETQRVEFTIENILSNEWIEATTENCTLLGGISTFGFDKAITYLKQGFKVKRKGWNGKEQYIQMVHDIECYLPDEERVKTYHNDIGSKALVFFGTSGSQIGWLASQSDMLADDWILA